MHAPAAVTDESRPVQPVPPTVQGPTYAPPSLRPGVSSRPPHHAAPARTATPAAAAGSPAASYLRTKVLTATPEQLQLMLYDGAIRFAEQGRAALEARQFDQSFTAITRAQNIISELQCTLRPDLAPETCRNLTGLYTFAYMRLVEANLEHDRQKVDEALQVLRYQRETWVLLMQEQAKEKASQVSSALDVTAATAHAAERLSLQG